MPSPPTDTSFYSATNQPKIQKEAPIPPIAESVNPQDDDVSKQTDAFKSMGTWEDHAKQNNLKVSKTPSRKLRRLRDILDSDDEWKEPKLSEIRLVSNPFCGDFSCGGKKLKRVCFNPKISFHYYEPHH